MINRTPGPGWTKTPCCAVFDHASGLRIHVHGMCWLPTGELVNGTQWPEVRILDHCVRVCGGNRRRGVMVWALQKQKGGE